MVNSENSMKILFSALCFLLIFESIFSENAAKNEDIIFSQQDGNNIILNDGKKDMQSLTDVRSHDLTLNLCSDNGGNLDAKMITEHQTNEGVTCKRETLTAESANNKAFSFDRRMNNMMDKYNNVKTPTQMSVNSMINENLSTQSKQFSGNSMNFASDNSQRIGNTIRREISPNNVFGRLGFNSHAFNSFPMSSLKNREINNSPQTNTNANIEKRQIDNDKSYLHDQDGKNNFLIDNNQMPLFGQNNKETGTNRPSNLENDMLKENVKESEMSMNSKRETLSDKMLSKFIPNNQFSMQSYNNLNSNDNQRQNNNMNHENHHQFMKDFQHENTVIKSNNDLNKLQSLSEKQNINRFGNQGFTQNYPTGQPIRRVSNTNQNMQNLANNQANRMDMFKEASQKPNSNDGLALRRQTNAMNNFNSNFGGDLVGQNRIPNNFMKHPSNPNNPQRDINESLNGKTEFGKTMIRNEESKNDGRNAVFRPNTNSQRQGFKNDDVTCKREIGFTSRNFADFNNLPSSYPNEFSGLGVGFNGGRISNYQLPASLSNLAGASTPNLGNVGLGRSYF